MTAPGTWPESLQPDTLQTSWHIPLEPSYSGPIVTGNTVFTTETVAKTRERVRALDRADGKTLWTQEWEGSMEVPFFAKANGSWIRSTPAFDEGRLYVAGMRDVLVCLNTDTGEIVWRKDFVAELKTPLPSFGFVCSPLVEGDHVYVQAGAGLICLDKRTGALVWRTLEDEGGMNGSAFSSPVIATLAGQRQLVVLMRETMAGVDLAEGKVLWRQEVPSFRGMNILTPSISGDRVLTATYGGKTHLFEVRRASTDAFTVEELWNYKTQGYMSSPIWIGDHAWIHLRNQRLMCLNTATGEEAWMTRESFGKYMSMISNGDQILALDQQGQLLLLRASSESFKLLDQRALGDDETWAHLALSGNHLFVRHLNGLTAYTWQAP